MHSWYPTVLTDNNVVHPLRHVRCVLPLYIRSGVVAPPAPCALRPAPVCTHRCVVSGERLVAGVGGTTGQNHVEPSLEKNRHINGTPNYGPV